MYDGNPAVGLYTLPLIIWYTLQLVIGTSLVPRLAAFVKSEEARLGITPDDPNRNGAAGGSSDDVNELEADAVEKGEAGLPVATAVVDPYYGQAMPWVQQVMTGAEQDSGTDADIDPGNNLSLSELDAISLASSGPKGEVTDTEGDEEGDDDDEEVGMTLDLDALSVASSSDRSDAISSDE